MFLQLFSHNHPFNKSGWRKLVHGKTLVKFHIKHFSLWDMRKYEKKILFQCFFQVFFLENNRGSYRDQNLRASEKSVTFPSLFLKPGSILQRLFSTLLGNANMVFLPKNEEVQFYSFADIHRIKMMDHCTWSFSSFENSAIFLEQRLFQFWKTPEFFAVFP